MKDALALGTVSDPHCGRSSDEYITLDVDGVAWPVPWGRFDAFGTAAYWVNQAARGQYSARLESSSRRADLLSETVFCLLGGFGVTAESATAAHRAVRQLLASRPLPTAEEVATVLLRPMSDELGRYRFPYQRGERIAAALRKLRAESPPSDPQGLREYLLGFGGVGPKTAAWIVRNVTGSAHVAIIDIWLGRALTHAGVFRSEWHLTRDYRHLEEAFLQYAMLGDVLPGALDLCIWEQARSVGRSHFGDR